MNRTATVRKRRETHRVRTLPGEMLQTPRLRGNTPAANARRNENTATLQVMNVPDGNERGRISIAGTVVWINEHAGMHLLLNGRAESRYTDAGSMVRQPLPCLYREFLHP
ncbi:MAG: hypothetical protein HUU22_16805 [Phycisphaerae bacterium]|nr:hypothetical protein [Phycisphaerae bacterium]NUQ47681.1 hypothetical protein [Phycisphaerae bacterium]